jgi:hypothetical protein
MTYIFCTNTWNAVLGSVENLLSRLKHPFWTETCLKGEKYSRSVGFRNGQVFLWIKSQSRAITCKLKIFSRIANGTKQTSQTCGKACPQVGDPSEDLRPNFCRDSMVSLHCWSLNYLKQMMKNLLVYLVILWQYINTCGRVQREWYCYELYVWRDEKLVIAYIHLVSLN